MLSKILKTVTLQPPKGIVYGSAGSGKTTFGAYATNALIIDCENGAGTIQCHKTPYLDKWSDIYSWLTLIEKEQHSYKTIVVDSLDWMIRRAEEQVCGTTEDKLTQTLNRSHGGYGNGKQVLKNYLYQLVIPMFDKLVKRGIAVVLLAHASKHEIYDEDGIAMEKVAPDIPEDYLNGFVEWSDFVGRIVIKSGQRELELEETQRAIAKNRYGINGSVPLNWKAFVDAITESTKKRFTAKGNQNG